MSDAYGRLLELTRPIVLLQSCAEYLGWDQEVMMPPGGAAHRADQLSALASTTHSMTVAPAVEEAVVACEADPTLAGGSRRDVALWRRALDQAQRVPAQLVAELAHTESIAQTHWAEARQASDFDSFRPWLEKLVELKTREADCLRTDGRSRWDALADRFEPDIVGDEVAELFDRLRPRLVALLDRVAGAAPVDDAFRHAEIDVEKQERFVQAVAEAMGFDRARGRIDRSTHPFCAGSSPHDVRITTRFHRADVVDALGSTMHEAGHGLYEQGLPGDGDTTLIGRAVSLGMHESQSRLWENHVGRSRGFWEWAHPLAAEMLGDAASARSPDTLWRAANRVQRSLIRVEADEATYDLHVMIRFQLERELFAGDLSVADIPDRWNALYRDELGVEVPDDARGCLQDVHWSAGLFGYFPTYTLGNLYAAQLFGAAQDALGGDLEASFAKGEFTPLREWLNREVHASGSARSAAQLCEAASGRPLSADPMIDHLTARTAAVYQIG